MLQPPPLAPKSDDSIKGAQPPFRAEIAKLTASEWSGMVDHFSDANISQTYAYGAVQWGAQNLSHLVLRQGTNVVAAAQLRLIPALGGKFGIAYLRSGPMCQLRGEELNEEVFAQMMAALRQEYVTRRRMFLRVLPAAYMGTARAEAFQRAFSGFQREEFPVGSSYRTMVLDLDSPLEVLRKQLDQKWRNQLNAAQRNNLIVKTGTDAAIFETFAKMYNEMHTRKQFESPASMPDFAAIQESLPANQKMMLMICEQQGAPMAGVVISAIGNTAAYLHGATSDAGLKAKGSYLLQWSTICSLKEKGIRYYDLGGINPATNPGGYHFKQGLSGKDVLLLNPFGACDSIVSKAIARTSEMARGQLRQRLTGLLKRSGSAEGK